MATSFVSGASSSLGRRLRIRAVRRGELRDDDDHGRRCRLGGGRGCGGRGPPPERARQAQPSRQVQPRVRRRAPARAWVRVQPPVWARVRVRGSRPRSSPVTPRCTALHPGPGPVRVVRDLPPHCHSGQARRSRQAQLPSPTVGRLPEVRFRRPVDPAAAQDRRRRLRRGRGGGGRLLRRWRRVLGAGRLREPEQRDQGSGDRRDEDTRLRAVSHPFPLCRQRAPIRVAPWFYRSRGQTASGLCQNGSRPGAPLSRATSLIRVGLREFLPFERYSWYTIRLPRNRHRGFGEK